MSFFLLKHVTQFSCNMFWPNKHFLDPVFGCEGGLCFSSSFTLFGLQAFCNYSRSCLIGVEITWSKRSCISKEISSVNNDPLSWFQVFRLQVNNGIPIKSWFDDPSDSALISLLPFLETLADADDVRPIIAKRFGNEEWEPLALFSSFFINLLSFSSHF